MKKKVASLAGGFLFCALAALGQDVPKGVFSERGDVSVEVVAEESFYEKSAEELFKEWKSYGFSLKENSGISTLSTGIYASGSTFWIESENILLPELDGKELLYVYLDHEVEVESYYDRVILSVSEDGGVSYKNVYAFSGRLLKDATTNIDISAYAGKMVKFKLSLVSDETYEGFGWNIKEFAIMKGYTSAMAFLRGGRLSYENTDLTLSNVQIDEEGNGSADFYLTQENKDILLSLDTADVSIFANGNKAGCLSFSTETQYLNIVFLIDNSGSMSAHQTKVQKSMVELIRALENYAPNAALIRFGQNANDGCMLVESNRGVNTFILKTDAEKKFFYKDAESLWSRNVQDGWCEQYYAALLYAAQTPFTAVPDAQTVIVMLGDEPEFNGENEGNCITGEVYTSVSQATVATRLSQAGAQVFVIQDLSNMMEYKQICDETHGGFFDINNPSYSGIAQSIGSLLQYKMRVTFCTQKQLCGETILFSANVDGVNSSSSVNVSSSVSVARDAKTELLDSVSENESVDLVFLVNSNPDCGVSVDSAAVCYIYNDGKDTVLVTKKELQGSELRITLPAEHVVGEKITYSVLLYMSDNGVQIGSPYVTHASWQWELGIENDRPRFSNEEISSRYACSERTFSIDILDHDGISSATLYYKNGKGSTVAYSSVEMRKGDGDAYVADLDSSVGNGSGFYYYVIAKDNRGLEANYGESVYPLFVKYETPSPSGKVVPYTLFFTDDPVSNCAPLGDNSGTLLLYHKNADCGYTEQMGSFYIDSNLGSEFEFNLYKAELGEGGFGFMEGEKVEAHLILEQTGVEYDLVTFDFSEDNRVVNVCVPDVVDSLPLSSYTQESLRSKVASGDTVDFGKRQPAHSLLFKVINPYYTPILINRIEIETNGNFTIDEDVRNKEIRYQDSTSFHITYHPADSEVAVVKIYNNSLQNPMVFYVKGEKDEETLCREICRSVTVYEQGALVQLHVAENLSEVYLALKDNAGNVLRDMKQWMGGDAMQNLYISTEGMNANETYNLYVSIDDKVCRDAFVFNGENPKDTVEVENCDELVKNLTVNAWGTMIYVAVDGSTEMMDIRVYDGSGRETDVHFGPQLMGGPTVHQLYLNTTGLSSGVYVVKVKVGNRMCSRQFVVG